MGWFRAAVGLRRGHAFIGALALIAATTPALAASGTYTIGGALNYDESGVGNGYFVPYFYPVVGDPPAPASSGNPLPVTVTSGASTPAAPDISTVTTGGTAVNAFSAGHCAKGCYLVNPKGASIDLCTNGITTASGTTTAGALVCVQPGQSIYFTPRATAISVVTSDSTHPFGGEGYQ